MVGKWDDMPFVRKCCIYNFAGEIAWEDPRSVQELENRENADCIVVAIKEREFAYEACRLIANMTGYPSGRIIDFYACFRYAVPLMTVRRVMDNPKRARYGGMVLGLSHAQVGILPELLDGEFCNLAVSGQDLFYNLKTLQYCVAHYPEKIKDLKYLVIDMYNYNYLNFDTSLSRHAINYLRWGGISLDEHNFSRNPNLPGLDFRQEADLIEGEHEKNVTDSQFALWRRLFPKAHEMDGYRAFANPANAYRRTRIFNGNDYDEDMGFRGTVKSVHEKTMAENEAYLREVIELAYAINPRMKIYLILIPRYHESQMRAIKYFKDWKEMFYSFMEKMEREYAAEFLDFKDSELAKDIYNYFDESHLNYFGAIKFTRMLNGRIAYE